MRRTLAALILALLVLGLGAAPALAQRDPFEPAINEEGEVQPEDEDEDEEEPAEDEDEDEDEGTAGDELADTGASVEPMLVLAYALLAFGIAAVIVARLYSSSHRTRPRRR
ncbi:MAG TPA: hypothetical protein VNP73_02635 [Actinomycetota bacterium]|nr:hypothetical protein [Actinomycetota bacterium]